LQQISHILQVPVAFFFEGAPSLIKEMFLKSLRWHGRAGDQDHRRLYLQAVAARRVTPSRWSRPAASSSTLTPRRWKWTVPACTSRDAQAQWRGEKVGHIGRRRGHFRRLGRTRYRV